MELDLSRCSINQKTLINWSLQECIEGCIRHSIPWIGVRREKIQEIGLKNSVKILSESGLKVSSLCFAGGFPYKESAQHKEKLAENLKAIEEAVSIGAYTLVILGGVNRQLTLETTRALIESGIEELLPYAQDAQVKLGIEPLHPMYAADLSALVTMQEVNDILERLNSPYAGMVIDVYHVWWEPKIYEQIARSKNRIVGFHVNDWITPITDIHTSRGMMGDGVIEIQRIRQAVDSAGYTGPVEVEIFNKELWSTPYDEVLKIITDRYQKYV